MEKIVNKQYTRSNRRRLVTISTVDGKWHGTWNCDYLVSLKDLNLDDLVEDDELRDAQIDTTFNVWILALNKDRDATHQFPEIGGDDPSVIYVKPGYEANLDSLIRDTIRLTTDTKDICSDSCRKSELTLHSCKARGYDLRSHFKRGTGDQLVVFSAQRRG